jgi:hypothetical protein
MPAMTSPNIAIYLSRRVSGRRESRAAITVTSDAAMPSNQTKRQNAITERP